MTLWTGTVLFETSIKIKSYCKTFDNPNDLINCINQGAVIPINNLGSCLYP